jgi:acyl-ACP--UDP-N-acetylglucosamine O-acyltransferase
MTEIHATAAVSPSAQIGAGCKIGPGCVIGPDVVLEDGVELIAHVMVDGHTRLGAGVKVFPFATIGMAPQDLKYKNEPTRCEIGARTQIREHATIHRGSVGGDGVTSVGADCLIMAVAHVAHDCRLSDRVILANNVMLGGHVEIADTVFVGGGTAIHQFVRIGRQAVLGGMSGIEADVTVARVARDEFYITTGTGFATHDAHWIASFKDSKGWSQVGRGSQAIQVCGCFKDWHRSFSLRAIPVLQDSSCGNALFNLFLGSL